MVIKFCGLVYRIHHLIGKICLSMFYNSFAKSVICSGLPIYGTGAKSIVKKIEMAQRRILISIFFREKKESSENFLVQNEIFPVFVLFLVDLVKELFRQLQAESPTKLLTEMKSNAHSKPVTRSYLKGFQSLSRGRTLMKQKCLQSSFCKSYN